MSASEIPERKRKRQVSSVFTLCLFQKSFDTEVKDSPSNFTEYWFLPRSDEAEARKVWYTDLLHINVTFHKFTDIRSYPSTF